MLLVAAAACSDSAGEFARRRASATLATAARSGALPGRFGFGRPATTREIERIDIDVGPDGVGLPSGRGTAAEGAPIFAAKCAACHGPAGQGTAIAMALVGRTRGDSFTFASSQANERAKTVGNYWPYATTLYDYIRRAMPYDHPGSLTTNEVYSVVAFILARNEIVNENFVIDSSSLPAVRMPARGRFVPDDREASTHVR
jgi:cytochrome c